MQKLEYHILPNTHAGANTEKLRGAPVYRSKSIDVERFRGIPELAVSFLMLADRAFLCTQLAEIKWLLVILDL